MRDARAPSTQRPPFWRRVYDAASAYPDAVAIGLYAVVAISAALTAYFAIFTVFAPYDDEGTLLVTLDAFVSGEALYRDIWSVYGPFYYELFGGFFALTGQAVTTDASRTIVVVIWVGTSLLYGLAAQRLSGRLSLGITAMIAAFATLNVLANEPMHPQVLCVLLLGAFTLVAVSAEPPRRTLLAGGAAGALLAALVLTKVNLGVYAVAAVVVAAAVTVEPLSRRAWLRWLLIAAFLAMPLVVLNRDLRLDWVRELLLLELLAAAAVLLASRPLWPARGDSDGGTFRWLLAGAGGFVLAALAIVVAIVLTGPSPSDVYDGVVTDALGIRDILIGAFPFPPGAIIDWAIGAVVAALLATRLRRGEGAGPSVWPGLLRAAVGLVILLAVAKIVPVALNPSSANPVVLPMLLAWVATIPPAGAQESPHKRFLRVALPLLAIAETLQIYPVPGSQLGIAALVFVPVGALCLGDAVVELRAWSEAAGRTAMANFAAATAALSVAVPALFGLHAIVLAGASNAIRHHDQAKLALPGAEQMRLPAPTVETYTRLVELLRENECSTFVSYPSFNSLYLWSELKAPPPQIPNAWMYTLDDAQQQRIVNELRATPRPCAIRNEELAAPYLKGLPPPDTPLVNYVFDEFRPVEEIGGFEFMLPKGSSAGTGADRG